LIDAVAIEICIKYHQVCQRSHSGDWF